MIFADNDSLRRHAAQERIDACLMGVHQRLVDIHGRLQGRMRRLHQRLEATILYVTHDLTTAYQVCDRVVVMYAGQEMESAPTDAFFHHPAHPYTRRLLESLPSADGEIRDIPGEVPSLIDPPPGCRFHPRCDYATPDCAGVRPPDHPVEREHRVRCYHPAGRS